MLQIHRLRKTWVRRNWSAPLLCNAMIAICWQAFMKETFKISSTEEITDNQWCVLESWGAADAPLRGWTHSKCPLLSEELAIFLWVKLIGLAAAMDGKGPVGTQTLQQMLSGIQWVTGGWENPWDSEASPSWVSQLHYPLLPDLPLHIPFYLCPLWSSPAVFYDILDCRTEPVFSHKWLAIVKGVLGRIWVSKSKAKCWDKGKLWSFEQTDLGLERKVLGRTNERINKQIKCLCGVLNKESAAP